MADLFELANNALSDSSIMDNSFFAALKEKRFSKAAFLLSQTYFYFAVRHFSRPMLILLSRMEDPHQRFRILKNVNDEHGNLVPKQCHEATFRELLQRLGATGADLDGLSPALSVIRFNAVLDGLATYYPMDLAISVLTIIERVYADISALIGNSIVVNGWLTPDNMIHYTLHATLDIKHANDFILTLNQFESLSVEHVRNGFAFGLFIFNDLFTSLYDLVSESN